MTPTIFTQRGVGAEGMLLILRYTMSMSNTKCLQRTWRMIHVDAPPLERDDRCPPARRARGDPGRGMEAGRSAGSGFSDHVGDCEGGRYRPRNALQVLFERRRDPGGLARP